MVAVLSFGKTLGKRLSEHAGTSLLSAFHHCLPRLISLPVYLWILDINSHSARAHFPTPGLIRAMHSDKEYFLQACLIRFLYKILMQAIIDLC